VHHLLHAVAVAHQHDHHPRSLGRLAPAGVVLVALVANTVLAAVQVVFGVLFGSIALLADSVHQITDVLGLGIALLAIRLAALGVTRRNTWGWGRADVLGALVSASLLLVSAVWITYESVRRLLDPHGIEGWGVLVVAVIGLVVNSVSAVALGRHRGSMATRAAYVHLVGDAAGSAGVLIAAIAVITVDALWVDPVVALAIAAWVAWSGWDLMRQSTKVLLNVVPAHLDADEVGAAIESVPGVDAVHHLHVWEQVPGELAVSGHVQVAGEMAVHDSQELLDRVRRVLHDRHGVDHTTFEVECHPCDDRLHGAGSGSGSVTSEGE
jgi:cobalt-zinc-cadmium efflux system protein